MKVCSYPHEYLLVDYFDGTVWVCPWMAHKHGIIENMLESSLEDVWHGEKAENIRSKRLTAILSAAACRHVHFFPLSLVVTGANRHDVSQLKPVLKQKIAEPIMAAQKENLCADAGYTGDAPE